MDDIGRQDRRSGWWARLVGIGAVALTLGVAVGCESKSDAPSEADEAQADEAQAEAPAVEWTPAYEGAHAAAEDAVGLAIRDGLSRTIPHVRPQLLEAANTRDATRPDDFKQRISLFFGGNVHGELEDCGCKMNPLGGLSRRKTLIDLASDPENAAAKKWWDTSPPEGAAHFVVDSGDLFYKSTSLDRANPARQEQAKKTASAIVAALNVAPPDVFNVGELDLAFGRENLEALADSAEFPFISANLTDENGEYLFPGHRVVERDGMKVAFVGLTKQQPRINRYYQQRNVKLEDPREAYVREVEEVGSGVDLVVMLSNLGMDETRKLVESLRGDEQRVDAVVVSNSNRRTQQPVWTAGVPMVEPASRGKYYGRLDLALGGDDSIQYANASESPVDAFQDYVSAWSSYANARSERERMRVKVANFERQLADREETGAPEPGEKVGREMTNKALEGRVDYLKKRLKVMDTRVERTSETVAKRHANLKPLSHYSEPGQGDDWAESVVVDVHIDIPEHGPVKKVVDRWMKKIE
ncbi:MAG: hypothetical protein ACQEVA_08350 [Myxococcota bacterium]